MSNPYTTKQEVYNFRLEPQAAFENLADHLTEIKDLDDISLEAVTNLALVSLAIPSKIKSSQSEYAINTELSKIFHLPIPKPGQSEYSNTEKLRLLGMHPEQLFILFEYSGDRAVEVINTKIKDIAYLSDQSDSWVMLKIGGRASRAAMERICMIDLHSTAFPVGSVSRTMMEHLTVIIIKISEEELLLLSPRSSANSFLEAVIQSIKNTSSN